MAEKDSQGKNCENKRVPPQAHGRICQGEELGLQVAEQGSRSLGGEEKLRSGREDL
jgi:hypothetical protein